MTRFFKYLLVLLAFLAIVATTFLSPLDTTPYKQLSFYAEIDDQLDSLETNFTSSKPGPLKIGFSEVSITPSDTLPLAGYSGREPMEFEEILNPVFVRSLALDNGHSRAAIVSAELLIIHPDITKKFYSKAKAEGWSDHELYLSATHTHSSIGGWSPGYVGELVTGAFDESIQDFIVDKMIMSLKEAQANIKSGSFSYANSELGMHVRNRLIKDGEEDAWVRNAYFRTEESLVGVTAYSAHATCFNAHTHFLTGDYPSYFHQSLKSDSIFSMYLAGAVASMGPQVPKDTEKPAEVIGGELASQFRDLLFIGLPFNERVSISSFKIPVPLRAPQLKVSENVKVRPWLFKELVGEQNVFISVLKINDTLLVGLPCDFSGEVALPLYAYAQSKGLNLIVTSFNGGYIGYVTKDDWYHLPKYETRTMNWYGPDSGAYFSEMIRRVIDTVEE